MKSVLIVTLGLFMFATTLSEKSNAQTTKKEVSVVAEKKSGELKVFGNCDMCKARIEKAAREVKGVKNVKWNKETKMLRFEYKPSLASIDDIAKKMAEVGHDTETHKATDAVYNDLHSCCKYR